ncbi:MAG TPA: M6 family metalloprotease domain-containing protein [Ignavibacteriales bacterium]|nr:M6 family metalloprotease domain-containing protein [Ignavibacteriales bacterium]
MFKNRIGYSLLFLAIFAGTIIATIPPHERVQEMIKKGLIPKPYFLQHYQELKERYFNASWRESLKKKGIQINSPGSNTLKKYSTNSTLTSTFRMLVILVDFSDKPNTVGSTVFDNLAFGPSQGTLKDYYYTLSSGTFDIVTVNSPSSVGWKRMPQSYSYYVGDKNGMGSYPYNAQKLAEDACNAVDGIVDFRNYDNDGDNLVDGLMIVHSGAGAEYSGSSNDMWSHTDLMHEPIERDGVQIHQYSICPEYFETVGDITCGVFAHEFAHLIFGLPDLFDINDPSGGGYGGLGKWSLMAAGSWNGSNGKGNSPAYPDAWSRSQMHWGTTQFATVININTNTVNQQIQSLGNSSTVYRVWKYGAGGSEYYMLENRQQTGYDSYLPGNGLLIYHIDKNYLDDTWEWYPGNTDNGHYKVALEQADGLYSLEKKINKGNDGDPFPGSTNKLSFSSLTTPNSNAYDGSSTYVEVTNISNSAPTMTADIYMGNVIVSQTLSGNLTQVGTVGRWNGSSFSTRLTPGQPFSVVPRNDEILQGDQGIYSNQKYSFWERNSARETDVLNHHSFSIRTNDIKFDSRFSSITSNVTIQNLLEGVSSNNFPENTIDFMDPWFISYKDPNYGNTLRNQGMSATFLSRPSPFSPNTTTRYENDQAYNGVLLNQTVTSGTFYSVRAKAILPINLGTTIGIRNFYFRNWTVTNATLQQVGVNPTGFDQKAVVFTGDNAVVTANYKGHLLSNTNSATGGSGSQRKITKDSGGKLHLVYESMGKIWHTTSSDGGANWTPEEQISGSGTATSPSIASSASAYPFNDVFCVWQETSGSVRNLFLKSLQNPGETVLLDSDAANIDLQPSVGISSDDYAVLVAYKKMNAGKYQMHYKYSDDCGYSFYYGGPVFLGTPIMDNNPSIAWNQKLWKFMVSTTYTAGPLRVNLYSFDYYDPFWTGVAEMYSSSQIPAAPVYSQVAIDGTGRTHVSWIAYDDYYGNNSAAMHRSYKDGVLSGISTFRDEVIYEPSIIYATLSGHNDALDGGVSMFYSAGGTMTLFNMISLNGTSWNGLNYITPSAPIKYPTALEKAPAGSMTYVTAKGSAMPYQIATQTVNNTSSGGSYRLKSSSENASNSSSLENVKTFRRLEIIDTTSKIPGRLVVQVGNFKGSSLSFYKSDSLKKKDIPISSFMRTEGFTFEKDASVSTELWVKKTGWKSDLKIRLELVEEGSGKVIQKVSEQSLGMKDSILEEKTLKVKNMLESLKAYLRLSVDGIAKENLIVNNMEYYLLSSGQDKVQKPEKEIVESETAPVEYALSQNYPNPFNPTTVINYEIPKTSKVTLKVYDMLGKEVATLVNEYKEQGRYYVKFNASNLPSGTYIYEMRADDFVKSGKMMLLK